MTDPIDFWTNPCSRGTIDFDTVIAALDQAVIATPYLAGDRFSAADVYTGSQIGWGLMFGTIPDRPAFRDYWAPITARPAYARTQTKA